MAGHLPGHLAFAASTAALDLAPGGDPMLGLRRADTPSIEKGPGDGIPGGGLRHAESSACRCTHQREGTWQWRSGRWYSTSAAYWNSLPRWAWPRNGRT